MRQKLPKKLIGLLLVVVMLVTSVGTSVLAGAATDIAATASGDQTQPVIVITPPSNWYLTHKGSGVYDTFCGTPTVGVLGADRITVSGGALSGEEERTPGTVFQLEAPASGTTPYTYTITAQKGDATTTRVVTVYAQHGMLSGRLSFRLEESCTLRASTNSNNAGAYNTMYYCRQCQGYYAPFAGTGLQATPKHKLSVRETIAAGDSCDGVAYTVYSCSDCSYVEVKTEGTSNGNTHNWTAYVQDAKCDADGIAYEICADCHAIRGVITWYATGHLIGGWTNSYPTGSCLDGGTTKTTCQTCKEEFVDELKPESGHTGSWKTVKAATCQEDGREEFTCSRCGKVETRTVAKGDRNHEYTARTTQAPTCTEPGVMTYTCKYCGNTYTEPIPVPAGGHSYAVDSVKSATCNTPGERIYKCTKCGDTYSEPIEATGNHVYTDDNNCATDDVCRVCGTVVIPAKPHEFGECYTKAGDNKNHYRNCLNCKYVQVEQHAGEDDGDCTTPLNCSSCGQLIRGGNSHHLPYDANKVAPIRGREAEGHARLCAMDGCNYQFATSMYITPHTYINDRCIACGYEREVHEHNYNDTWLSNETGHYRVCQTCGQPSETIPHDKSAEAGYEGDCTKAVTCSICGYEVLPACKEHTWESNWNMDDEYHYRNCTVIGCTQEDRYDHVGESDRDCTTSTLCKDCGYVMVEGGTEHSWAVKEGSGNAQGHILECTNPDCDAEKQAQHEVAGIVATCKEPAECYLCHTRFGEKDPHNHVGGDEVRNAKEATEEEEGYTGDLYCLGCGQILQEGQSIPKVTPQHQHDYSLHLFNGEEHWIVCKGCNAELEGSKEAHQMDDVYVNEGDVHSRTCIGCAYKLSETHEHTEEDYNCETAIECKYCNAIIEPALVHDFTGRAEGDQSGHWVACVNPNCRQVSEKVDHVGGTASCTSGKHCDVCGIEYTEKDTSFHTGGTHLVGQKDATMEAEGYTGDLYCDGCGQLIEAGQVIEKIPAPHEHSFGAWRVDGSYHYRTCACGEVSDYGEHTYADGVCTVCGAKDPTAQPPHEHSFGAWQNDGAHHYRTCACGERDGYGEHTYANGVCTVCGAKAPQNTENPQIPPTGIGGGSVLCAALLLGIGGGSALVCMRRKKSRDE